jgi:choice-of-anchor A domain-containing protein
MRMPLRFVALVAALGGVAFGGSDAWAACPAALCDCLGEAGRYAVVGNQVQVKSGRISVSGYGYSIPTLVEGSLCGQTGKVVGKAGGEADVSADLLFTAGTGVIAAKFKGYKYYGYPYPGAYVAGDVATGGGSLVGTGFVDVGGVIDTTGAYPEISSCAGALVDAASASVTLAALTPTQSLGAVLVTGGGTFAITGASGVNVVDVDSINVKSGSYDGYPVGSSLEIDLPGPGDVMIVNVAGNLQVGNASAIFVVNGAPENVILNVHGGLTSKVKIAGFEATIDPPILAPGAKVLAKGDSILSNLLGGAKTKIAGPQVADVLFCP